VQAFQIGLAAEQRVRARHRRHERREQRVEPLQRRRLRRCTGRELRRRTLVPDREPLQVGEQLLARRCAVLERECGVEILRREQFDALIIDVYLPILDGPKVISTARTELGLGELPIIAVSAGGDAARRSALEAGANIFLDKPMRLRQVLDTIQRLLH